MSYLPSFFLSLSSPPPFPLPLITFSSSIPMFPLYFPWPVIIQNSATLFQPNNWIYSPGWFFFLYTVLDGFFFSSKLVKTFLLN
jgi:hypothetical protein